MKINEKDVTDDISPNKFIINSPLNKFENKL